MLFAIGFQESSSPLMEGIVDFHNHVFFYLVLILTFVVVFFCEIVTEFLVRWLFPSNVKDIFARYWSLFYLTSVTHHVSLEVIWTLVPSLILIMIAIPSFVLLYIMDEVIQPIVTLKAVGHQWYWSYEYGDAFSETKKDINFDSYLVHEDDLVHGQFRLLEVDNCIVLPAYNHIRVIVTALDVLHAWTVPSLGVKVDAVPGRLNQLHLFSKRQGVFYGQCSELCGVNHGFMPITVRFVEPAEYILWLHAQNLILNYLIN